ERRIIGSGYPVLQPDSRMDIGFHKGAVVLVAASAGHDNGVGATFEVFGVDVEGIGLFIRQYLPIGHKTGTDRNIYLRSPVIGTRLLGVYMFKRGGSESHLN